MSLLQEIASWLADQPEWLSDAARRVLQNDSLAEEDIDDLLALLKVSVGLPDKQGRKAVKLDESMIPREPPVGTAVSLTGIRQPVRINAIGNSEGISFEPEGLTIVYGYNASGKSGYARALKSACRARDQERILPDVFNPPDPPSPATARFEWKMTAGDASEEWIDGQPSHPDLSAIAVFDTRCARLFVDDENEVAIVPYGLDILRELARGCDLLRSRLEAERESIRCDVSVLSPLKGETVVGKLVAALGAKTGPEAVKSLATLSETEADQRKRLTRLMNEEDPAKIAAALRRLGQRVATLKGEIDGLRNRLSDVTVGRLREAMSTFLAAEGASKIAAEELAEGGRALKGTGSEPWRELVESAMRFATEGPFPGEPFPSEAADTRCVLCQQSIGDDARERLARFVRFLEADTQKRAAEKRKEAGDIYRQISEAKPGQVPSDKSILDEISERGAVFTETIPVFLAALETRKSAVEAMAKARNIGDLSPLPADPTAELEALQAALTKQANDLEKTVTPEVRKERVTALAELNARVKLAELLPVVLKMIEVARLDAILAECVRQTATRNLTLKSNELQEKAVAAGLNEALTRELKENGLALKLNMEMRGAKGAGLQKLTLDLPKPVDKMKLSDVLSEGEQRAIAIAAFLAEAGLSHSRSGIVFDDPVSSLDHLRRERIAKRFAREALTRQVIVFTHNLAFAWELVENAKALGAKCKGRHVFCSGAIKGLSMDSLPHEGGKLDARANDIRTIHAKARKAIEKDFDHAAYDLYVRRGYNMLRDCWERLIEEVLFGETVRRFRNSVNTKNLKKAHIDDEDFDAVTAGMTRCSNFTHDAPTDAAVDLPTPDAFLADIEAFAKAFARAKTNNDAIEKRRTGKRTEKTMAAT